MNFASTSVAGSDDQDDKVIVFCGFFLKSKKHENIDGNSGSNPGVHHEFSGGYGSSFNFDDRLGSGYGLKWHENGNFVAKGIKIFKSKGRIGNSYGSMVDFDHSFAQDVDSIKEFPLKTLGDRSCLNVGFKPKNYCDFGGLNGVASRQGLGRKNNDAGVKRGVDHGSVRMEKMKMEMVKEIEKMRMEMEMKHNEMIVESQQKIMDALLSEKKKMVKKPSSMFPNTNGNVVEGWQEDAFIKKKRKILSSSVEII
ncbi:protein FIP2-like [Hibiscus syriacus]|uniref:protein FIP2-like n=1 Tax=Hibiscus syriacus TaxID=106335 RepID=UPI00192369EB|nr:protein FIP2-like [Hibiscus syriacus]